ncbi:MAG: (2Fe-2S) ferredoxin domain-containing protein [Calditrichia bacterium]|nr:(2Fe-2S) ferredoxin domain-containing protein [Calditrichia bacterium]
MKLKPEDLEKISDEIHSAIVLRDGDKRVKINVHMGTCGIAAGAQEIFDEFNSQISNVNLDDIILTTSGCAGFCSEEPLATIELKGAAPVKYSKLTKEKVKKIFKEHIINEKINLEFALAIGSERVL